MNVLEAPTLEALQQIVAGAWERRLAPFPEQAVVWVALLPRWTEALAEAVRLQPRPSDLSRVLDDLQAARLCDRVTHTDHRVFWMPSATRDEVLDYYKTNRGASYLLNHAAALGERLQSPEALRHMQGLPDLVQRWAELVAQLQMPDRPQKATLKRVFQQKAAQPTGGQRPVDVAGAVAFLDGRVAELLAEDQTGEALAWVRTGQSFGELFGGRLEAAARLAERRLEIAYRRAQDARLLTAFLPRQEQIDAFTRLVVRRGGERGWALHYLGVGGVGKTMLLRYIAGRLAGAHGYLTSRIDFDYISPQYPARKPGQLLLELADELRIYGDVRSQLLSFRHAVDTLHEKFSGPGGVPDPVAMLTSEAIAPVFATVMDSFVRVLSALERPVVLILDTCEELAKYRGSGHRLPSVEATFYILHELHRRRPDVRVVFAGRRLLAQGGAGWHADAGHLAHHHLPEAQPFMDLHLIRGFTRAEAERFFEEKKKVEMPPDVLEAVLAGSREVVPSIPVRYGADEVPVPDEARYNPFDLALYADWVREEPDLASDVIASGEDDPYVERRIQARLKPSVERLLPAVALLGRFDKRMLVPLLDAAGDAAERQFRDLADQEWIDYQRDEELEVTFLGVNPNLLVRLRRYYRRDPARHDRLEHVRAKLGPHLAALVRGTGERAATLRSLGTNHVDAALRLLSHSEAARLWSDVEQRIPAEAGWGWALAVTGRLLGADGAAGEPDHPLRAALLATQAAATIHQEPGQDVAGLWEAVADALHRHPYVPTREPLDLRCALGKVQARARWRWQGSERSTPPVTAIWEELIGVRDHLFAWMEASSDENMKAQLAASYLAALSDGLDAAEAEGTALNPLYEIVGEAHAELITNVVHPHPDLQATLLLYHFKFLAERAGGSAALRRLPRGGLLEAMQPVSGDWVGEFFAVVEQQAPAAVPDTHLWFDWVVPTALKARTRLTWLRSLPPEPDTPHWAMVMETWLPEALAALEDIDQERLASHILRLRLAHACIPPEDLEAVAPLVHYDGRRLPTCYAHTAVPPLAVVLAEAYTALGDGTRAVQVLSDNRNPATRTAQGDAFVQAANEGLAYVVRRARARETLPYDDAPTHAVFAARWLTGQGIFGAALEEVPQRRVFETPPEGPRTRALQTLERAELLALAQPGDAVPLLTEAGDALQALNDVAGCFQARVLQALAGFRVRRSMPAEPLRDAYRNLLAAVPHLPTWTDLRRQVDAAWRKDEVPALVRKEPALSGWLFRLATVLVLQEVDPEDRDGIVKLAQWLERFYGDQIPDELRLLIPADVPPGRPRSAAAGAAPGASMADGIYEVEGAAARTKEGGLDWKALGLGVFGLVIAFGAFSAGYLGFRWLLTELLFLTDAPLFASARDVLELPGTGRTGFIVILYVVALLLFVGGVRGYARARSGVERLLRVWLAASDAGLAIVRGDAPGERHPSPRAYQMVYRFKPWMPSGGWLAWLGLPARLMITGLIRVVGDRYLLIQRMGPMTPPAPEDAYARARGSLPEPIHRSLHILARELGDEAMPFRLGLDADGVGAPWEAWIAESLCLEPPRDADGSSAESTNEGEGGTPPDVEAGADTPPPARDALEIAGRLWMWRSVAQTRRPAPGTWRGGGVRFIASRNWDVLAMAWTPLIKPDALILGGGGPQRSEAVEPAEPDPSHKVIHVIGEVIETTAGLRWQVQDSGSSSGGTTRGMGALYDASQLAAWNARLIVVQQEPVGIVTRTAFDREQATRLRRFAAEISALGTPAVLVLPGLPSSLAEAALRAIAGGLDVNKPPTLKRLLEALQEVRRVIAGADAPPRDEASTGDKASTGEDAPLRDDPTGETIDEQPDGLTELAFDVCLFYAA